jgi:hypothetical protein
MEPTFRRITPEDIEQHLQPVLEEMIAENLANRQPGHCMRVGSLSGSLMTQLATSLTGRFDGVAMVHILGTQAQAVGSPLFITSSKLIELRNPLPDGTQRLPLLVFVPDDLRTSAEDSFSGATFEQMELTDSYEMLKERLLANIPNGLRAQAEACIRFLADREWPAANVSGVLRFLLSLKINGYDEEVLGAAICELGLVPDFKLLDDPAIVQNRLSKNHEAAKNLLFSSKSVVGRVLEVKIATSTIKASLIDYLSSNSLEDPVAWTSRIAAEPQLYGLSFDKWGSGSIDDYACNISIEIVSLDLPEVKIDEPDPKLRELLGQRVLVIGPNGPQKFGLKFRCMPGPSTMPDLDHFKIQVVSRENGPTGIVKKKPAWDGPRLDATQSFTKIRSLDWEEGWHYVRVLPYSADGDILPIVNSAGNAIPVIGDADDTDAPHESDLFYVICDSEIEVELPQRAVPRFPSLQHAIITKLYGNLSNGAEGGAAAPVRVNWLAAETGADLLELVEFKFPGEGAVNIPLSRPLRQLEQAILASPDSTCRWSLSLNHSDKASISQGEKLLGGTDAGDLFLTARKELFGLIAGEDGRGVVELARIASIEDAVLNHAAAYSDLVGHALRRVETAGPDQQKSALESLSAVLSVDSVSVCLTDFKGGRRTGYLVAPTHPLRLLWLTCWSKLACAWADQLRTGNANHAPSVRQALFESLAMINFPAFLVGPAARILQPVDNIHPLWTLYASADEPDPRGLVAELCTALSLPEAAVGGFTLNGEFLANRLRRYVIQHPYVQTLTLNCFNAGRGKILADALLALQRNADTRDLRYDIRVFAANPEAPGVGEDLGELISPSSSLTAAEADVFATPTGDHLSPKLTFAVRRISDFQDQPSEFAAHITLLFDVFPAQSVGAKVPDKSEDAAPIHGLLQDFSILYEEDGERVAWHKCPRHGRAVPIPSAGEHSDLLCSLAAKLSNAAATMATGQAGIAQRPISTLVLGPKEKALLHQVHEVSDWVFTIDKSMGVEFFDHRSSIDRPEYLIDHSPNFSASGGRRVVITSRSQTEIRVLFERVLAEHGLAAFASRSAGLLAELRVLSGRLALKLVSASTHRAEALGLALGKLFLEYQSAFACQAVVPLDSHVEMLRPDSNAPVDLAEEVSLRRTDLALFDLDASSMTLVCRLVEVKCYKDAGGSLESLGALKANIAEQLNGSEQSIRKRFNQELTSDSARPDKVLRTQELCNLLEFYVERASRLGLLSAEAYMEAKYFLRSMELGYELRFTKSALIFDFEKPGFEESLRENGIEYHRIGRNLIEELIGALPATHWASETVPFAADSSTTHETTEEGFSATISELRSHAFPLVEKAAFLPPPRDRTVSWDRGSSHHNSSDLPETPHSVQPSPIEESNTPTHHVSDLPGGESTQQRPPVVEPEPETRAQAVVPSLAQATIEIPSSTAIDAAPGNSNTNEPDVLLGSSSASPQFGHIARLHGRTIALDLNQTQTISLFGVQGGGKSYTLGTIIEMATMPIPGVNQLPKPLATVVFHYSQTQDYKPEFTSMNKANDDAKSLKTLMEDYAATGKPLSDIVLLAPEGKLAARQTEYPGIQVLPLKFASSELQAGHWRFLMGAVGNQATYIRRLNQLMRSMRENLTLQGLRTAVENAGFTDSLRDLAMMRLDLAETYIDDTARISEVIRPGRLVIVDLRDEFIEKDEALGLFVVLLQLFSDATYDGEFFNKLVVFDEAHKYIGSPDLVDGLVSVVREMRHKGTSILVASQDPPSVPLSLIELSTQIIMHRFNSPKWLKHIQTANAALSGMNSEQLARLQPGEAFVWSAKATDRAFSTEAIKVKCRPRITKHGGDTKTAVG